MLKKCKSVELVTSKMSGHAKHLLALELVLNKSQDILVAGC